MILSWDIRSFERLESTNREAQAQAAAGAREGAVIWAREQTAGYGRRGRAWMAGTDNLTASVILRPERAARETGQLAFVLALAIGEALSDPAAAGGAAIGYKWPNDVLLNGRKLGGILLESSFRGDRAEWVVAGFGVNLRNHPTNAIFPATDLLAEGVVAPEPGDCLDAVLAALAPLYRMWTGDGFAAIRARWREKAVGLGEMAELRLADETFEARLVDLDDEGALLVAGRGGQRRIHAGEVFWPPQDREPL
ncbi:MAG: biotin--[acetyl-CoA-carboxylase] ligase [Alphaproteobacteria bacterium]